MSDDIKKVEELTKALNEGKTLVNGNLTAKIINGVICVFDDKHYPKINAKIDFRLDWQVQEPEPPFEITEAQLAEYECRDGSKAVCYGVAVGTTAPYWIITSDGDMQAAEKNGLLLAGRINPKDLIRKIREL